MESFIFTAVGVVCLTVLAVRIVLRDMSSLLEELREFLDKWKGGGT